MGIMCGDTPQMRIIAVRGVAVISGVPKKTLYSQFHGNYEDMTITLFEKEAMQVVKIVGWNS